MAFIEDHPHYSTYRHEKWYCDEIPRGISKDIHNLIYSYLLKDPDEAMHVAVEILHKIQIIAKLSIKQYLSFEDINYEIKQTLTILEEKEVPDYASALEVILSTFGFADELNQIFEDNNFGYTVSAGRYGINWMLREDTTIIVEQIEEVIEDIPNQYQNTIGHLHQAIGQLNSLENERARKDALRDCISAVEGYIKSITGTDNFPAADTALSEKIDGEPFILRDGLKIWKQIHRVYPDVRHGNNETVSNLSEDELSYYIDRLMIYIKFINKIID
ncbi:TPA: hypothetical protein ACGN81_005179 [Bacillus cereus]|uniref:hypothetical protein n=1 Tax=Bacillus albus TaxID=2026189 RepID=UPI0030150AF6